MRRKTLAIPCGILITTFFGSLSPSGAWALERVNLRNGFSYDCARSVALDGTHVRLYLSVPATPSGERPISTVDPSSSYVDLPASEIVSTEMMPDPPPQAVARSPINTARNPDLHALLTEAGSRHNIDAELLASIVHAESGGRAAAVSRVGAIGLMQLMPGTAAAMGVADAFRPEDNVAGGTSYFDHLLTRYHDNLALALAAYNAGPAAVDHYGGVPPFRETRAYVARIMTEFKRRKLALQRIGGSAKAEGVQVAQNHSPQHGSR